MVLASRSCFTTLPWAGSGRAIQSQLRCSTSCQTSSDYLAGVNPSSVVPRGPSEPSESPGTRFLLSQTLYAFHPKGPGVGHLGAGGPEKAGRAPSLPLEVSLCCLLPGSSSPTAPAASCSPRCRLSTTCFQRPPGSGESGVCDGPHPWRRSGWNPGRQSLGGAVWGTSRSPSAHPRPWCQKVHEWSRFPGRRPLAWKTHAGQSNGSQHPAVLGTSGSESQTISSWPSSRRRSWRGVWSLGFGQAPLGTFRLPSSWTNHGSLHEATKGRWVLRLSWDRQPEKTRTKNHLHTQNTESE